MCECNKELLSSIASRLSHGKSKRKGHVNVNKQLLLAKDMEEMLRCGFQVDPDAFKKEFSEVGIDLHEEDIPGIIKLLRTGGDVNGEILRPDKTPIKFSVLEVLGKVQLDNEKIKSCKINMY